MRVGSEMSGTLGAVQFKLLPTSPLEEYPALQVHEDEPTVEVDLSVHEEHEVAPAVSLYVLASHRLQVRSFWIEDPV